MIGYDRRGIERIGIIRPEGEPLWQYPPPKAANGNAKYPVPSVMARAMAPCRRSVKSKIRTCASATGSPDASRTRPSTSGFCADADAQQQADKNARYKTSYDSSSVLGLFELGRFRLISADDDDRLPCTRTCCDDSASPAVTLALLKTVASHSTEQLTLDPDVEMMPDILVILRFTCAKNTYIIDPHPFSVHVSDESYRNSPTCVHKRCRLW